MITCDKEKLVSVPVFFIVGFIVFIGSLGMIGDFIKILTKFHNMQNFALRIF
jgi:hypothetical protein